MDLIYGVVIQWVNKKTVDFNNVQDSDYRLIKPHSLCPTSDGNPVSFDDPSYEWLIERSISCPDYDPRIYLQGVSTLPTNTPDEQWPNYNKYLTKYSLVKRTNDEIITAIRAEEANANTALINEGEKDKTSYFMQGYLNAMLSNVAPTEAQVNAEARHADIEMKMSKNAANAELLISQLNAGQNIDLSSGWEYDHLPVGGFPFAN